MTPKPPPTDGPKHSPTPWEMNKSENGANSPRVAVHAFIGEKLKKIGDLSSFTPDDRAFIVRAVNAYEEAPGLLDALADIDLRTTQARLASGIGPKKNRTEFLLGEIARIGDVARAAILAAKGGRASNASVNKAQEGK